MSKHISEESKGPRKGHAAGDTSIEQQASQLASDIKYKARQKMKGTSGSNLSPGQVQALYRSLLNSSPAPSGVKALVKKKLFGEEIDRGEKLVAETLENKTSKVFGRVFVEGGGQKVEVEEIEEAVGQKFVIRVTDKATGNTTYRKADRAKIAELRANKNISSVEITGRKKADDAYGEKHEKKYGSAKGKNTVGDKDGDGTEEPDRHEYAGVKDRAIKKAMAKEEIIYEKEEGGEKKLDVMKGKNTVKVNPTIGESIRAELDALKAQKVEEAAAAMKAAGPSPEERQQLMNKDKILKKKIMMQKQVMQMQKQGRLPLNYSEETKVCEKCGKSPCECDKVDEREMPTKATLFKNKLRARGIQVAGLTLAPRNMKTYDELEEGSVRMDRMKDRYLGNPKETAKRRAANVRSIRKGREEIASNIARLSNSPGGVPASVARQAEKVGVRKDHFKGAAKTALKNSFEVEGEMTESAEDRARDEHLMRGGMAARKDYDRPPAKKLSNKELGIKPGKTWVQKQMEKKKQDKMTEEASDRARDEHQMRGGMAARKDYDRPPAKKLSNKELGIKPGKTWVQKQMEKK